MKNLDQSLIYYIMLDKAQLIYSSNKHIKYCSYLNSGVVLSVKIKHYVKKCFIFLKFQNWTIISSVVSVMVVRDGANVMVVRDEAIGK